MKSKKQKNIATYFPLILCVYRFYSYMQFLLLLNPPTSFEIEIFILIRTFYYFKQFLLKKFIAHMKTSYLIKSAPAPNPPPQLSSADPATSVDEL